MARRPPSSVVAASLRARLAGGGYQRGELLPSEADLAGEHGVSRATVRKALLQLKDEGLVDSRQGLGWFPVGAPVRQALGELRTIEEQVAAAGRVATRRVLRFGFLLPPAWVGEALGSADVLEVVRVTLADDRPLARVTVWVPAPLAGELSRSAVERLPISHLLDVELGGATQAIGAVPADPDDAHLLGLPLGAPLLRVRRVTHDVARRAVLASESMFDPLLTEFEAELPAHVDAHDAPILRLLPGRPSTA